MASYPSDLEIANAAYKKPIEEIAESVNISKKGLIKFGEDKAKFCLLYTSPSPRD